MAKTSMITVRVTESDHAMIRQAARAREMDVTAYLVASALGTLPADEDRLDGFERRLSRLENLAGDSF